MKYVYRLGKLVPKEAAQYVGGNRGPYVLRDEMEPTEQVDGVFYTSKAKFRAKGRELGLIEVGNEKFPVKQRSTADRLVKEKRIQSIRKALAQWESGDIHVGSARRQAMLKAFYKSGDR